MEGWGGICKWKKKKEDPRKDEKICAYASGKFKVMQSIIDAEINACINSLEKLKIYYLDKKEITLRTDCQASVSFYNKTNSNKASRVRWLKFADIITGTGLQIYIEHIDGKQNVLANSLSRLVNLCFAGCTEQVQAKEVMMKSLQITEKLLQDIAQSRNVKSSYEQITQISGLCHRFILARLPSSNQEPCIDTIKSKPPQLQYHWQNQVPMQVAQQLERTAATEAVAALRHLHAILDFKAQTTTGEITGPKSKDKIRKPDESFLNSKNYVMMWAESKYDRPNQSQAHYKYRPVHGYFLDVSSDNEDNNEETIVDPSWDDFSLQSIKKFRPDKEKERFLIIISLNLGGFGEKKSAVFMRFAWKCGVELPQGHDREHLPPFPTLFMREVEIDLRVTTPNDPIKVYKISSILHPIKHQRKNIICDFRNGPANVVENPIISHFPHAPHIPVHDRNKHFSFLWAMPPVCCIRDDIIYRREIRIVNNIAPAPYFRENSFSK
ncbi:hypothetical protein LXL04_001611 [Taraxacum kok-saghyz]